MKEEALRAIQIHEIYTRWEKWRELKIYESTNSLFKSWEKVMRQCKGSVHNCRKCKSRWILWMIQGTFKKWSRITVGDCLKFPVNQQWFEVLVPCWAATNACHLTHGIRLDYRKTFFGNLFSAVDSSRNHYQRIHHSMTPGDTGSVPVHIGTRTPVARDEDHNRDTIPMPTFAIRPSTISSLFPVDIPSNSMVAQQRQQISELQFDKFPTLSTFWCWKKRFKNQVSWPTWPMFASTRHHGGSSSSSSTDSDLPATVNNWNEFLNIAYHYETWRILGRWRLLGRATSLWCWLLVVGRWYGPLFFLEWDWSRIACGSHIDEKGLCAPVVFMLWCGWCHLSGQTKGVPVRFAQQLSQTLEFLTTHRQSGRTSWQSCGRLNHNSYGDFVDWPCCSPLLAFLCVSSFCRFFCHCDRFPVCTSVPSLLVVAPWRSALFFLTSSWADVGGFSWLSWAPFS